MSDNPRDMLLHLAGALADSTRGCVHIATVTGSQPAGRLVGVLMLDTGDHTGRPPQLVLSARCGCHVHLPIHLMVAKLQLRMSATGCVDGAAGHDAGEYTEPGPALAPAPATH